MTAAAIFLSSWSANRIRVPESTVLPSSLITWKCSAFLSSAINMK